MSAAVILLMAGGALGWGALALAACRVRSRTWIEHVAWAFPLGAGLIGWLAAVPPLFHHVAPWNFALIPVAGLPGLLLVRPRRPQPLSALTWILLAVAAAVALGDLFEALAPPTDADSLAYHYAIPRQILREGHLVFIPRALDGAIPLLQQMTSLVALAVGGERAMTLWAGLSGWAAVLLTYAAARRHLGRDWSLAAALVVATLPAWLYGAGTGQVEVRLAALVLAMALALGDAAGKRDLGTAALAGLAAGLAIATKYPALFLALIGGLMLLGQRRGVAKAAVYGVVAGLAGCQWYLWNWVNIGDPVFPMLYGILTYPAEAPWSLEQNELFRRVTALVELALPRSPANALAYPILATLSPPGLIEAGRTGLGPFPLLVLPFAAAGAWAARRRLLASGALSAAAGLALGFYLLWFFFGASQRVRHFLPLMPLLVVCFTVAAVQAARMWPLRRPLAAAVAATLALQTAGQGVFAKRFVERELAGTDRATVLSTDVAYVVGAAWINAHLGAHDKVLVGVREWLYFLDVPALLNHPIQAGEPKLRPDQSAADIAVELARLRLTHVVIVTPPDGVPVASEGDPLPGAMATLLQAGCAHVAAVIEPPPRRASRTLGGGGTESVAVAAFALHPEACGLSSPSR